MQLYNEAERKTEQICTYSDVPQQMHLQPFTYRNTSASFLPAVVLSSSRLILESRSLVKSPVSVWDWAVLIKILGGDSALQ